jgi:hypothetical protein
MAEKWENPEVQVQRKGDGGDILFTSPEVMGDASSKDMIDIKTDY